MNVGALQAAADGRGAAVSAGARSRRRWVGVTFSLLFHASFLLLALGTMQGVLLTGGTGDPDGGLAVMDVSLAGFHGGARAPAADPSREAIADLFAKIRAEQSQLAVSDDKPQASGDLQHLFQAIDRQRTTRTGSAADEGSSSDNLGGKGSALVANGAADRRAKSATTSHSEGPGAAMSAGDLWGQIKPCWDELPAVATVPVTLRIVLNERGRIAKPPIILRPASGAPDERRLVSESRALAALAACVPYNSKGWWDPKQEFEVRFAQGR